MAARASTERLRAFASWELLPWIVNTERSHLYANGDGAPITDAKSDRERAINDFAADLPPYWGETRADAPTGAGAIEYLKKNRPRVFYVMLGETDEWAHGRRYDLYLDAAWRNDRFIRRLWETAQSMPDIQRTDGASAGHRSRPGQHRRELDEPRREGSRVRSDLDGGDGPWRRRRSARAPG